MCNEQFCLPGSTSASRHQHPPMAPAPGKGRASGAVAQPARCEPGKASSGSKRSRFQVKLLIFFLIFFSGGEDGEHAELFFRLVACAACSAVPLLCWRWVRHLERGLKVSCNRGINQYRKRKKKKKQLVGVEGIKLEMVPNHCCAQLGEQGQGQPAPPADGLCRDGALILHPKKWECKSQITFSGCPVPTSRQPATCWSGQQLPGAGQGKEDTSI